MEVARGGIPIIPIRFSKDGFEFARDILKGLNAGGFFYLADIS